MLCFWCEPSIRWHSGIDVSSHLVAIRRIEDVLFRLNISCLNIVLMILHRKCLFRLWSLSFVTYFMRQPQKCNCTILLIIIPLHIVWFGFFFIYAIMFVGNCLVFIWFVCLFFFFHLCVSFFNCTYSILANCQPSFI